MQNSSALQLLVSYKHRIRAQPFTGTRGARDPALTIFRPASNVNNIIRPECLSRSVTYTRRLLNNIYYNILSIILTIKLLLYHYILCSRKTYRRYVVLYLYLYTRYLAAAYTVYWTSGPSVLKMCIALIFFVRVRRLHSSFILNFLCAI